MDDPQEELIEERKPASLLVAQFFLFPLIIIAICVGVFVLFGRSAYTPRTPRLNLQSLQAGSESQRWQAAYELSSQVTSQKEKLDPDFVDDLIKAYRNVKNGDPRLRRYLALAIGQLGDKRALEPLLEELENDQLQNQQCPTPSNSVGIGRSKHEDSIEIAKVENQYFTLFAIGIIGDNSAVPAVEKQLKHPCSDVRQIAASVLGKLKDVRAAHSLQVALADADERVRLYAAMALADMNDSAGTDLLIKALDRDGVAESKPGLFARFQKSVGQFLGVRTMPEQKSDGKSNMTSEEKAQFMIQSLDCLVKLQSQAAREKMRELSRSDPSLAVRGAALDALKKY